MGETKEERDRKVAAARTVWEAMDQIESDLDALAVLVENADLRNLGRELRRALEHTTKACQIAGSVIDNRVGGHRTQSDPTE